MYNARDEDVNEASTVRGGVKVEAEISKYEVEAKNLWGLESTMS